MSNLSERLFELRQESGASQEAVAAAVGITSRTYIRYEKGEREPSASLVIRFADFFQVTADYLLGRSDVKSGG